MSESREKKFTRVYTTTATAVRCSLCKNRATTTTAGQSQPATNTTRHGRFRGDVDTAAVCQPAFQVYSVIHRCQTHDLIYESY